LNTVPYTFILIAHINALNKGSKVIKLEALWEKISGYLESFDARQIRYLGNEFMTVIDAAAGFTRQAGQVRFWSLPSLSLAFT
jgi:COP9 signalosome complex subunit 3